MLDLLLIAHQEVVSSFLLIAFASGKHLIVDQDHTMGHRNGGAFASQPLLQPTILCSQVGIFRVSRCMCRLHQGGFDPMVALIDTPAEAFATTLMVAR